MRKVLLTMSLLVALGYAANSQAQTGQAVVSTPTGDPAKYPDVFTVIYVGMAHPNAFSEDKSPGGEAFVCYIGLRKGDVLYEGGMSTGRLHNGNTRGCGGLSPGDAVRGKFDDQSGIKVLVVPSMSEGKEIIYGIYLFRASLVQR
jgi:hypothetical protein